MPRYSILIPTLNRPDTLRYALRTALNQISDDYEVVVSNNGGNPATTEVIRETNSRRVREVTPPGLCSMSDNWEFGVEQCRGEFITVLGDDDGVMPDLISTADNIINSTGAKVLSWETNLYWWPNAASRFRHNTLHLRHYSTSEAIALSSRSVLKKYYDFEVSPIIVPMIYYSFVHRSIIDQAKRDMPAYFHALAPDIFSGIVNLHYTDFYVRCTRPLAVSGISGHSNGYKLRQGPKEITDVYATLKGKRKMHPSVFESRNEILCVVDSMATAKDYLFPDANEIKVNTDGVIWAMINSLSYNVEFYDQTLDEITRFAAMSQIDISNITLPSRQSIVTEDNPLNPNARHETGPVIDNQTNSYVGYVVDGNKCNMSTILDAVNISYAMAPTKG